LVLGALNGISGLYNFITIGPSLINRLGSLIGHFGDTFNLMLPIFNLSLSLLFLTKMNKQKRIFLICLFFISMVVLLQTMTRSIWGATFLSFFIILFYGASKNIFKKVSYVVLICLALIIVLYNATDSDIFLYRLFNPLRAEIPIRGALLMQGFEIFKENPIIGTGVGTGLFFGVYEHKFLVEISEKIIPTAGLHNQYLTVAMEMGILGLMVFLYFVFKLAKKTYQAFKQSEDRFFKAILLAVFATILSNLIAMTVGGGIIPIHSAMRTVLYFWILCGVAGAIERIEKKAGKGDAISYQPQKFGHRFK